MRRLHTIISKICIEKENKEAASRFMEAAKDKFGVAKGKKGKKNPNAGDVDRIALSKTE